MRNKPADANLKPDELFDSETETIEAIGPYSFIQKKTGNRYTEDSVSLVNFLLECNVKGRRLVDLGTGAGVLPILLADKLPAVEITGVEVVAEYAGLAQRNVRLNGLSSRIKIVSRDYRDLPQGCPEGSFDIVISNPPYMKAGAGRQSPDPARRAGRSEVMGGLKDLLAVSCYLLGKEGRMFFVFPFERMGEMIGEMDALGIKPMRILRGSAANGKKARVFFIEAGRVP